MSWAPKSATPPPDYEYGPPYRASLVNVLRGLYYILRGRPRSLAHDALYAMADMPLPPLARGEDLAPEHGPLLVVANHYERPGLWMVWPALFLAHVIRERTGQDTHYIAIREWATFSVFGIPVPRALIRALFERVFHVYGILAMPPPDAPAASRAAAMREAGRDIRRGWIIGLMPEGAVGPTPELLPAPEGVGTFMLLLGAAGARLLPVGLYEENSHLVARLGQPFTLKAPPEVAKADRDRWARDYVMRAIRDLLPPALAGAYRAPAEQARREPPAQVVPADMARED